MKIRDISEKFRDQLSHIYPESESNTITKMVLSDKLNLSGNALLISQDQELTDINKHDLLLILKDLEKGKPVQYILGHAWFYGLKLKVDPSVLIPRQETEELVDWALHSDLAPKSKIMDIGSGSGCIAIAMSKNLLNADVYAIDISQEALKTAAENAMQHECNISLLHMDVMALHTPSEERGLFDAIMSNPPYVKESEIAQMHINVKDHEPHSALFVSDEDPLIFYRKIGEIAIKLLKPEGFLFFEINEAHGFDVRSLLDDMGFRDIELRKDSNEKERMIRARK